MRIVYELTDVGKGHWKAFVETELRFLNEDTIFMAELIAITVPVGRTLDKHCIKNNHCTVGRSSFEEACEKVSLVAYFSMSMWMETTTSKC